MKKILTIAPLQHVEAGELTYNAVNNDKLQYDTPTCFPVLPLIHGYVEVGESVELYVLTTENHETALGNFQMIEREVINMCKEKGVACTVDKIGIPFDETVETHLNTFQALIITFATNSRKAQVNVL